MGNETKSWIDENWTFRSKEVAERFDRHVREQLPWYDLATQTIVHFARHYVPAGGVVYDIGASTGNVGRAISEVLRDRGATFTAIEESPDMAERYEGPETLVVEDATAHDYKPFDFAICFLVLMFVPIGVRDTFLTELRQKIKPGGAIVVVDKINTPSGWFGTALRRLAMQWKVNNRVPADEIIEKELSLAGYQRPIEPEQLLPDGKQFFQFGEFGGWLIEAETNE